MTALVLGYWCLLFISTHVPAQAVKVIGSHDKLAHFFGYGTLAWLTAWAVSQKYAMRWKHYIAIWLMTAVYGVIDELLQMIPILGRSADVKDWVADVCGAACALAVYALFAMWRRKWRHPGEMSGESS